MTNAGIRRAVIAIEDPNPLVHGRGLAYLRERGVEVVVGVERERASAQNAAFLTSIRLRRPHVTMKVALSVDGRIAAAPRESARALTGPAANRRVHRQRAEVDAIAIGSGTLLVDDPLLTARGAYRARPLTRVVFDRRLRTPPSARLLSTLDRGPVIIVTTAGALRRGARPGPARLTDAGARILASPGATICRRRCAPSTTRRI